MVPVASWHYGDSTRGLSEKTLNRGLLFRCFIPETLKNQMTIFKESRLSVSVRSKALSKYYLFKK